MPAGENLSIPAPEKKWRLGFWSLIATQFQGAFNENGLKFLVIYLILAVEKHKAQRDQLELLVGVLFAAPFILFSLTGGYLADRFSKRAVTIWTKVFEVGVMLFAAAALVGPNLKLALVADAVVRAASGTLRRVPSSATYSRPKRCGRLKSNCTVESCHRRPMASTSLMSIFGP